MYESLSCGEQGQNQQPHVDLCSSWFAATIVHQGINTVHGANVETLLTVVGKSVSSTSHGGSAPDQPTAIVFVLGFLTSYRWPAV